MVILQRGEALIAPVLRPHGFKWRLFDNGPSSGGPYASGEFERNERRLELHFRTGLGLVSYHVGLASVVHSDLMRFLGHKDAALYPNVSSDRLDAFRCLASDLANFCSNFITGSGETIAAAAEAAAARRKLSGFRRLSS